MHRPSSAYKRRQSNMILNKYIGRFWCERTTWNGNVLLFMDSLIIHSFLFTSQDVNWLESCWPPVVYCDHCIFISCLKSHVFCCFIYQSLYGYGDLFSETWRAFTDHDIIHLKNFDSKRVKGICSISLHIFLSIWVFLCLFKSALFTGVFQRRIFLTPSKNAIWPFLQQSSCMYPTRLCCSHLSSPPPI